MTFNLTELQQEFQSAVLQLRDTPPDFVVDSDQISATDRFNVYTEAYRLRLIGALRADYPALEDYLGDDGFNSMTRAYIDASPSDQFSIRWFGRHLPQFLATNLFYAKQSDLIELARFEWALSEAFDAAESSVLDYQQLAAIDPNDWASLKLYFHPSLRRIDLNYNAPQVWKAANEQQPRLEFIKNDSAQAWIIWRQQIKLLYRSLSPEETFAIDAFLNGQCFADVCAGLCDYVEEQRVATKAVIFLQSWLTEGLIAGVISP
jgi:hypothetical protein